MVRPSPPSVVPVHGRQKERRGLRLSHTPQISDLGTRGIADTRDTNARGRPNRDIRYLCRFAGLYAFGSDLSVDLHDLTNDTTMKKAQRRVCLLGRARPRQL